MKPFLKTTALFSLSLLAIVLLLLANYFLTDPFRVISHYDDYSYPKIIPNRDFISTQSFINNYPEKKYDSFIFGSSRTLGFKVDSWKHYLEPSSSPFVFDASSESLAGIYQKIKYLDSMNVTIHNALIILCRDCSFLNTIDQTTHLIIKHPATSKKSKLGFHMSFLSAYFDNKFLVRYLVYQLTGQFKPWMRGYIEFRNIQFDPVTNQLAILDQEEEIKSNEEAYYNKRQNIFYERKKEKTDSVPIITEPNVSYLKEIKRILEKQKTKYKIVLSPLYEQVKFNPNDLALLNGMFDNKVYDFSGKNCFTDSYRNYYEASHFRPFIGDSIMARIYK